MSSTKRIVSQMRLFPSFASSKLAGYSERFLALESLSAEAANLGNFATEVSTGVLIDAFFPNGKVRIKVVPLPSSLSKESFPPNFCTS